MEKMETCVHVDIFIHINRLTWRRFQRLSKTTKSKGLAIATKRNICDVFYIGQNIADIVGCSRKYLGKIHKTEPR